MDSGTDCDFEVMGNRLPAMIFLRRSYQKRRFLLLPCRFLRLIYETNLLPFRTAPGHPFDGTAADKAPFSPSWAAQFSCEGQPLPAAAAQGLSVRDFLRNLHRHPLRHITTRPGPGRPKLYLLRMIIDGFPRPWVLGNFKGWTKFSCSIRPIFFVALGRHRVHHDDVHPLVLEPMREVKPIMPGGFHADQDIPQAVSRLQLAQLVEQRFESRPRVRKNDGASAHGDTAKVHGMRACFSFGGLQPVIP